MSKTRYQHMSKLQIVILFVFAAVLGSVLTATYMFNGYVWDGSRISGGLRSNSHALTATPRKRVVWTVFSNTCDGFSDWQAQALLHNHRISKLDGLLVRLMSCDIQWDLPKSSYSKYRVVVVPDFNALYPNDSFPPRNKANSFSYWLDGKSKDNDLPHDDDVIILADPDQLFVSFNLNFDRISHQKGLSATYGMGSEFVHTWARSICDGKCDNLPNTFEGSYGPPYLLTARDSRIHSRLWKNLTEIIRPKRDGWLEEMYTYVIAAIRLDIQVAVEPLQVSNAIEESEPWSSARWYARPDSIFLVVHYCQTYTVGTFSWSKHMFHDLDIRQCDYTANFPSPNSTELYAIHQARGGPLYFPNGYDVALKEEVYTSRHAWLLLNTRDVVSEAIFAYYEEFCFRTNVTQSQ